ncbi:MAG TPA: hypothetical protein VM925_37860, partial [Labilithrix sp.]|nr:hypothetical protein [Labilithrix sp.]
PLIGLSLLALAFLAVPYWIRQHTSGGETWIFVAGGPGPMLTAAGTWTAYVTVPLYVFLLLRWIWRWMVLALVFRRSAPLLRLVVSHGDHCGGFSFVSRAPERFALVIAGISSAVSARWLFTIIHEGVPATAVTKPLVATLILSVILAFFPVLAFAPEFKRAKRTGLRRYRVIVEGHARNVEREWARRPYPVRVSSEESSSLADLNSVYASVRTMQPIPYRRTHLLVVVLAALAPMIPVLWLIVPVEEVLRDLLKAVL